MQEVSVSEPRNRLPEYLVRAESGEEVLVTRRGRVIARLSAAHDARAEAKRRLAALRARARLGDVVSRSVDPGRPNDPVRYPRGHLGRKG